MNTQTITRIAAIALTASTAACAAAPASPVAPRTAPAAAPTQRIAEGGHTEMCQIVRRGETGEVRDARIAEHWPTKNYGSASAGFAGTVAGGARQTLLAFDLPALPEGAVITSATVRLHKNVCGGSGVNAHRITRGWDESDVTWASFDAAYDKEPVARVPVGSPEHTSLDITELAEGWRAGSVENHGVLLSHHTSNTAFSTSEVADASDRPTLEICWTTGS